jgi:hypothetical protein
VAQSTWSAEGTVWSGNSNLWSNDTYQVTASMTQTNLTQSLLEDTVFPRGVTIGSNFGMSGTTAHVMPAAITLDGEGDITDTGLLEIPVSGIIAGTSNIKNNVNFEESATMGLTGSALSDNTFLWNDVEEDEDTLWTKISDPDE